VNQIIEVPIGAMGYVFQTDAVKAGWSYVGQSTRLDSAQLGGYFGSGDFIRQALREHGPAGLRKRLLATADNQVELHYLEMLYVAQARRDGKQLLNGDFGGPRPFSVLQLALWNAAPGVMRAASDPERFYQALVGQRGLVEQAILDIGNTADDEFYAGMERDLYATQDLAHACPSCGSAAGEVCRTNAQSPTLPHQPARNHAKRPLKT
jgi:hypothetical protein